MNVGAHLSKRAELNPGLEALVDDAAAQRFTFAELDERANRAAHMLTGLGLTERDRVAVLLPNGHQFVETFYGAARAGLVVVPLNGRLVANELSFMLRDSGATVLVFDGEHDTVVADLRDRGGTDDGTPVVHWVRVGANGPAWALDFDALVQGAPADPVSVDVDGDHPLFIMYTSGTTGLPKGALHTHDSRGPLRPHGRRTVPPHRPIQPLAPRPRQQVHLRTTRPAGHAQPRRHRPRPRPGRCLRQEAGSAQHPKMSVIQPFLRHAALDRQDVLSRAGRTPTPPGGAAMSLYLAEGLHLRMLTPCAVRVLAV